MSVQDQFNEHTVRFSDRLAQRSAFAMPASYLTGCEAHVVISFDSCSCGYGLMQLRANNSSSQVGRSDSWPCTRAWLVAGGQVSDTQRGASLSSTYICALPATSMRGD